KGQVTIPKAVRERLGIGPGSQVAFELAADGNIVLKKVGTAGPAPAPDPFAQYLGRYPMDMTTDELMELLRGE
ncbi:MAG: AbrB/MazE/SpoVT family DNA-binding domain-containing protein, partial [Proteobacteria bacterium]|nr:AbrB/MazE/SpoVT family DNA-binding domain-containing protein [Pseudomonadota bacterium]